MVEAVPPSRVGRLRRADRIGLLTHEFRTPDFNTRTPSLFAVSLTLEV
jgi:hypothetical protein